MTEKKNNSLIYIIISIIALIPNTAGLLVACFALDSPPIVLYIVPSIMIIGSLICLKYGMSLRKKATMA
jgi:hypothetical protein